jgi:hypothetical protein
MKVKMTVQVSGTRNGVEWPAPGETVDVPDDEAAGLVLAGLAETVAAEPETAAVEPSETAAVKRPRSRKS